MLKPMHVYVKYEITVRKEIVADDNDDLSWEGQGDRFEREVSKFINPAIKNLKARCPQKYWKCWTDCTIETEEM